jgi:uncharacterized protein (DUF1015 family)
MINIKPFKGIRPKPSYAHVVASKPYDVLNSSEARKIVNDNPLSFLGIIKPETTLPETIDPYSKEVYEKARGNFNRLLNQKVLFKDDAEKFYVYRQTMGSFNQTGLVALSSVEDYFADRIKKHEFTRPEKEKDRINHIQITGLHTGPVFLTYHDVDEINKIIDHIKQTEPEYDFEAGDGVQHTLWVVNETNKIDRIAGLFSSKVEATYIADGHHRAASSAKVGKAMAEEHPEAGEDAPWNYFLSVLFPSSQLNIIDYNRVVKDLNGMTPENFIEKLNEQFVVNKSDTPVKPSALHEFGMYIDNQWYILKAKPATYVENDPVKTLDVSILQENILSRLLDIHDPRTDKRIDFVGGIRGLGELEKMVGNGEIAAAFSLFPVTIQQLIDIADSGEVMPPKSTWFEPKLRSGLVTNQFK